VKWSADGSYELEPDEVVAQQAFEEMGEWGHADALGWAHAAVFLHYRDLGQPVPAMDVTFWEWLVWPDVVGPVVEAPARLTDDGEVQWVADDRGRG